MIDHVQEIQFPTLPKTVSDVVHVRVRGDVNPGHHAHGPWSARARRGARRCVWWQRDPASRGPRAAVRAAGDRGSRSRSRSSEDGVTIVNARGRMDVAGDRGGHRAAHPGARRRATRRNAASAGMARRARRRSTGTSTRDGVVTAVQLAESDLGAWPIEKCLLEVARSATFGKPTGGDADFTLPLDFSAEGRPVSWDEDQALRAVGGQLAALDECAKGNGPSRQGEAAPARQEAPRPPGSSRRRRCHDHALRRARRQGAVGRASRRRRPMVDEQWADVRREGRAGVAAARSARPDRQARGPLQAPARAEDRDGLRADRRAAARPAHRARLRRARARAEGRGARRVGRVPASPSCASSPSSACSAIAVPEELGGAGAGRGRVLARDAGARARRRVGRGRGVGDQHGRRADRDVRHAASSAQHWVPRLRQRRAGRAARSRCREPRGRLATRRRCARPRRKTATRLAARRAPSSGSRAAITPACMVVWAVTDPGAGHKGITAFLVPGDAQGPHGRAARGQAGPARLVDRAARARRRRGRRRRGARRAGRGLRARDDGARRRPHRHRVAGDRHRARRARGGDPLRRASAQTFGQPIIKHQAIGNMLADAATWLDAATLMTLRAAYAQGAAASRSRSRPRWRSCSRPSTPGRSATSRCRSTAATATSATSPSSARCATCASTRIYEGTSEIQRIVIARNLLQARAEAELVMSDRRASSASSSPSPASTATIAAPRSSRARSPTPATRSSTPGCTRRPR